MSQVSYVGQEKKKETLSLYDILSFQRVWCAAL